MNITTRKTNAFYGNTPIDQMRVIKNEGDWDIDEANTFTNNISTQFFNNIGEQDIKLQLVYYFRDTNFFVSSKFFGKEQGFQAPSTDNYDFDENLLFQLEKFLEFEDEILINFYNHGIIENKIEQNEISNIFKHFKL